AAKTELEKLDLASGNLTLEEGIRAAVKIILIAHEDNKDKDFELEMSWVTSASGPTKGRHEGVPQKMVDDAMAKAKAEMEGDDEEE
ncbi:hypothetical protein KEM55_001847, partial [Ascosphaera atra]